MNTEQNGTSINNDSVQNFLNAKKELLEHFGSDEDYFIKSLTDYSWAVKTEGDFSFLTYWQGDKKNTVVVVRRNNEPIIYKKEQYTMVIGIDCVKMGFIFKNEKQGNE